MRRQDRILHTALTLLFEWEIRTIDTDNAPKAAALTKIRPAITPRAPTKRDPVNSCSYIQDNIDAPLLYTGRFDV